MRAATTWEFRHRFWIITGMFVVAFSCRAIDHQLTASWLAGLPQRARGVAVPPPREAIQAVFACAALIALVGAWLRTWAAAYLHSTVVHDSALHADRVVADGPYRHLRNPLYVGMWLAGLALTPAMSRVGAVFLLLALGGFAWRLIAREEAELRASGGESYRRFCDAVPRIVPAWTPRLPASGAPPRWGQAFLGEAFFWAFVVGLAVLAATLEARSFLVVIAAAFVLRGLLAVLWWQKEQKERRP